MCSLRCTLHAETLETSKGTCFVERQCPFNYNITCKHSKALYNFPIIHRNLHRAANCAIRNSLLHIYHTQNGKALQSICSNQRFLHNFPEWGNHQMGSRNTGQQPWNRVIQCSTGQEGDTFPSHSTVPPWQETLICSVCHSGFSGFCVSVLESLTSGMSVS